MNIFSLKNKVAIVTGATGLLGKQHCIALAEAGANVVACDLNLERCEALADSLSTKSVGFQVDVTSMESIFNMRTRILESYGHIDILVNNAAINDMFENPMAAVELSKFEHYPLDLWNNSLSVNLTGVFLCSQIIGQVMIAQEKGSIINIASTYGVVAPNQSLYRDKNGKQTFFKPPAYSVTKAGVIAFTKYLAAYWGDSGIRVNALSPGGVENAQEDFFIENYSSRTPLGRMAKPEDYRGALIFLASDASSYMTGANLIVDGGYTIW
jgi:NAD(P)-dependent dehydrogenase (short-subunit alcohol dehydrogenase family)